MKSSDAAHGLRSLAYRALLVTLAALLVWYMRDQILNAAPHRLDEPQRVTLVDEEPPPPPKEEIHEEPEAAEDEVLLEENLEDQPTPDDVSSFDDALGVDAEGLAGFDAFGLMAKKGGRDILALVGEQSGFEDHQLYGGLLASEIERVLAAYDSLRQRSYSIVLQVWITAGGRIERLNLLSSSGHAQTDLQLKEVLSRATVDAPPPKEMPQPVRIRITSRRMG